MKMVRHLRGGVEGRLMLRATRQVSYVLYLVTVEASELVILDREAEGGQGAACSRCPSRGVAASTDRRRTPVNSFLVSGRV